MKKVILVSLTAVLFGSCGIYKSYEPEQVVPHDLYGSIAGDDTLSLATLKWHELFQDPRLQELIEKGLLQNTDLRIANQRVEQSEATLRAAKLAFLPGFALAPQGVVSSFDQQAATRTYSLPVTANWQLDLFGGLLNAKRQSEALFLQSKAYSQAVKTQLIAAIANSYYTLLMLDTQYAISLDTRKKWEESVHTARSLKAAGMYTEAGVAQTEATYYSICTSVEDLKEQINQVENALNLLLAQTPHSIERGTLSEQSFTTRISAGVPLELLSGRPDVQSAEQALAATFYGVAQARSAFYPSLTLSGSAGWTNSAGQFLVNPGKLLASAVGSLTQPLFNKGQNRARLKIARADQEIATLNFQQTLLQAGTEVNNALTQLQNAQRKSSLYEKQIASLETAVHSTRMLMKHGNTNYLEVLTAEKTLLSARLTQTANRFAEIQGIITLYQALGGGSIE